MASSRRYYITTPIYYVNDRPHMGHAYTTLACDVLARFKRLDGYEVKFLTGTDEHGEKVQRSAERAGLDPQSFTDQVSQNFRALKDVLNFSPDEFIRTTEPRHIQACQALWRAMEANGDIYLDTYAGWYSVRDEAFFGADELIEQDGKKLAPTGSEVEWVEGPSYFFRLSAWAERLLAFYEANPDFIAPASRRNEVISFVKGGLRDLSVSRTTFNWGVPVPGAPEHVMYVWVDALTNYMTAAGYPDTESDSFQRFWPADLHMIGKDILRFHAVYWPAFLMSAGLPVTRRLFAHGWLLNRGQKMSKSIGNVVTPDALRDRYGVDQTRYFLLREVPFGADGYISHEAMVGRINGDLANDIGNLSQRVLSMIAKNCGGAVPQPGPFIDRDHELLAQAEGLLPTVRDLFESQAFHRALEAIWGVVGAANRYVDEQAPWTLRRTDVKRMETVLYVLAETIRHLAILTQPVMPGSMGAMLDQLAVPEDRRAFSFLGEAGRLEAGAALPKPQPIFPRFIEEAEPDGAA